MTIKPDTNAAVDFLLKQEPEGPWAITAITVPLKKGETKSLTTRTFGPGQEEKLRAFIDEHNGKRNLYYGLNPTIGPLNKKAERADIKSVDWLHVDIDARAGEPLDDELARIHKQVTENLPASITSPSGIVFTGGGYQLIWRLEEPIPIDGDLAKAEDAKLYNIWLENRFGADRCHNIDRILRLPGTLNIPDWLKTKKGRVKAVAKVIKFDRDLVYTLGAFKKAPAEDPEVVAARDIGERITIEDASELDRYARCRDDKDRAALVTAKIIMGQGEHPDRPKPGDNSRSVWLFEFCCTMARLEVPDEVVLGVLLDKGWGVSESVLEQKAPETYAKRQIKRAHGAVAKDKPAEEFSLNDNKVPYPNQRNIRVALRKLGVKLSHDQFADRLLIEGLRGHGPALQDESVTSIYLKIDERYHFRPGKDFFWMVVEDEARRHAFNPVHDYLDGLTWDGTPRIDKWLTTYGKAEDSEYTQAVGSLMMLAAVRRARQPGCKFDEMLVLISPKQGTDKSSALAALVPNADWFSDDLPLGADTKIIIERLHGRWIVEAAELKGMRKSDREHLKAFLSRQIDRARMAYGRIIKEVQRACVIVGTTNDSKFLTDITGNRRYWPVKVKRFDVAAIRRDRDQLWAEAAHREAAGESIRLDPTLYDAAAEVQSEHEVDNQFIEVLDRALGDVEGKIRSADCWDIVGVPAAQRVQEHNDRMGTAMRALGWGRKLLRFGRATPEQAYFKGDLPYRKIEITRNHDGRWRVDPAETKTAKEKVAEAEAEEIPF